MAEVPEVGCAGVEVAEVCEAGADQLPPGRRGAGSQGAAPAGSLCYYRTICYAICSTKCKTTT